jgi:predicted permease
MLLVVITASLNQNIFDAVGHIWPNWWFKVTLVDAYFGFLTIFVWVAYRERSMWRKLVWFAAFMLLGNVAISSYILLELAKLREGESFDILLTRRNG